MSNEKMNKIMITSGITVVSLVLLAVVISSFIERKAPDPKQLGPKRKVTYMASKQFARLPEQEKVKYMKKVGRSRKMYRQLSSTERKAVAKNTRKLMLKEMKQRMNKFFAMSKEEQDKYLDERIAQRDKWRKNRPDRDSRSRSTPRNKSDNNKRYSNRNARRQHRMEGIDSTTRAQMSEFRRRMRERRQQTQGK
jgi:isopenicillin N synthase-like dioxygenase